jgi:hypothetical protein
MGGLGSTRWDWHRKKKTVENCLGISTAYLRKEGLLNPDCETQGTFYWQSGNSSVGFRLFWRNAVPLLQLRYTINSERVELVCPMTATQPHYGGVRWWFVCPLIVNGVACRKRVGKLYAPPRQKYFGCRHCHNLSYRSRQEYDKRIAFYKKNPEALPHLLEVFDREPKGNDVLKDLNQSLMACKVLRFLEAPQMRRILRERDGLVHTTLERKKTEG